MKCILYNGSMKIDLWRMLIIYEFGGWYTDIDNIPAKELNNNNSNNNNNITTTDNTIQDNDSFFVTAANSGRTQRPNQNVFAMIPRHPIATLTIQRILYNIYNHVSNIQKVNVVKITGPGAFNSGYHDFFKLSTTTSTTTLPLDNDNDNDNNNNNKEGGSNLPPPDDGSDSSYKHKHHGDEMYGDKPGIYNANNGNTYLGLQIHKGKYWNWKNIDGEKNIRLDNYGRSVIINRKDRANIIGNTPHWKTRKDRIINKNTTSTTTTTTNSGDNDNDDDIVSKIKNDPNNKIVISCREYLCRLNHDKNIN